MSTEILDSIDGALSDYATSKDAMRWAPPESRPETEPCPCTGFTVDLNIDAESFVRALADVQFFLLVEHPPRCPPCTATTTGAAGRG